MNDFKRTKIEKLSDLAYDDPGWMLYLSMYVAPIGWLKQMPEGVQNAFLRCQEIYRTEYGDENTQL